MDHYQNPRSSGRLAMWVLAAACLAAIWFAWCVSDVGGQGQLPEGIREACDRRPLFNGPLMSAIRDRRGDRGGDTPGGVPQPATVQPPAAAGPAIAPSVATTPPRLAPVPVRPEPEQSADQVSPYAQSLEQARSEARNLRGQVERLQEQLTQQEQDCEAKQAGLAQTVAAERSARAEVEAQLQQAAEQLEACEQHRDELNRDAQAWHEDAELKTAPADDDPRYWLFVAWLARSVGSLQRRPPLATSHGH